MSIGVSHTRIRVSHTRRTVLNTREICERKLISFAIRRTVAEIAGSCCPLVLYLLNLPSISDASRIIASITWATGLTSCTRPILWLHGITPASKSPSSYMRFVAVPATTDRISPKSACLDSSSATLSAAGFFQARTVFRRVPRIGSVSSSVAEAKARFEIIMNGALSRH